MRAVVRELAQLDPGVDEPPDDTSSRGGCVTTASATVRPATTTRSAGAPGLSP